MFSVNIDLNECSVANLTPVETYTQWNTSMIVIESILIIFPKLSFPNLCTFHLGNLAISFLRSNKLATRSELWKAFLVASASFGNMMVWWWFETCPNSPQQDFYSVNIHQSEERNVFAICPYSKSVVTAKKPQT